MNALSAVVAAGVYPVAVAGARQGVAAAGVYPVEVGAPYERAAGISF
ncbi:MAG: hypothetical protein FWD46_07650 [Cystobacterineae bacterium]|nr:hypothetical protein [Cystobacterineae bacterium]